MTTLRDKLEEELRFTTHNAKSHRTLAARVREHADRYEDGARDALLETAAEHGIAAQVADAKAHGLRFALALLDKAKASAPVHPVWDHKDGTAHSAGGPLGCMGCANARREEARNAAE